MKDTYFSFQSTFINSTRNKEGRSTLHRKRWMVNHWQQTTKETMKNQQWERRNLKTCSFSRNDKLNMSTHCVFRHSRLHPREILFETCLSNEKKNQLQGSYNTKKKNKTKERYLVDGHSSFEIINTTQHQIDTLSFFDSTIHQSWREVIKMFNLTIQRKYFKVVFFWNVLICDWKNIDMYFLYFYTLVIL